MAEINDRAKYTVRLKPGHPTGEYRRAGRLWRFEGQEALGKDLPDEVFDDLWLIVTDSKGHVIRLTEEEPEEEPEGGDGTQVSTAAAVAPSEAPKA